jgi:hypothetical protein
VVLAGRLRLRPASNDPQDSGLWPTTPRRSGGAWEARSLLSPAAKRPCPCTPVCQADVRHLLHDDARYDRDMDSMSLVKGLPDGMSSQPWPAERYAAKAAFDVVAGDYANP